MCKSCLKGILCLSILHFATSVFSQTGFNAPYSRFGLGDPISLDFASLRSMGGISTAYADPFFTNLANPASLGALQATAFEIGFDATRANLIPDEGKSDVSWGGNMNYFSLAFPLINPVNRLLDRKSTDFNWGMAFSLLPTSRVSHFTSITDRQEDIGRIKREYKGSGGTNQFLWSNGFKYKQWRFGFGLGYLFGSIKDERTVLFEEVILAFHDYALRESSYRGFSWKGGVQYEIDLSNGAGLEDERDVESITIGLAGNSRWNFRALSTVLDARFENSYTGLAGPPVGNVEMDTLQFMEDVEIKGKHPAEFSLGLIYQKSNRWLVGINYRTTGWSNYQNALHDGQVFSNASQFSVGAQYVPDASAFKFYHQRIRYRAGFRFGTDPRVINEEQIKELGLAVGFGLPIVLSRQLSFINLGVEFNRRAGQIPIKENFVRFNIGVTLNNNLWFLKRKFN